MGKFQFVVFSNAAEGQDEAFNRWYDDIHLDEVLSVPGFASAKRYRVLPSGAATPPFGYLALYDIVADDPAPVLTELKARAADGRMRMSNALGNTNTMLVEELPSASVEARL